MHYILPKDRSQITLACCIELWVSENNPVRLIDALIEGVIKSPCSGGKFEWKGKSNEGRKAYSPSTMLKLYLYGYLNGISSSRKLERETHRNIELMWLLGDLHPDFKTIADYRKDNKESIRFVAIEFRRFLREHNYIEGKGVGIDGTKIKANAGIESLSIEQIERRINGLEEKIGRYLEEVKENDILEDLQTEIETNGMEREAGKQLIEKIIKLEKEVEKLRGQKTYLEGEGKSYYFPADKDAELMKTRDGLKPSYNVQGVVDNKHKMICVAEVVTDQNDIEQLEPMIAQLEGQIGIVPEEVEADKGYCNVSQIEAIEEKGETKCYIPLIENKQRKKDKEAGIEFIYDKDNDCYTCNEGGVLVLVQKDKKKRNRIYDVYRGINCKGCNKKKICTSSKRGRIIHRDKRQEWIEEYERRMDSEYGKQKKKERKEIVEHVFGTLKCLMGKVPLLLRGKEKVQIEIDLWATIYNFKRLINIERIENLIIMMKNYNWARV